MPYKDKEVQAAYQAQWYKENKGSLSEKSHKFYTNEDLDEHHIYAIELFPNCKRFKIGVCKNKDRLRTHAVTLGNLDGLCSFEATGIPRCTMKGVFKMEKKVFRILDTFCTRVKKTHSSGDKSEVFDAPNKLMVQGAIQLVVDEYKKP